MTSCRTLRLLLAAAVSIAAAAPSSARAQADAGPDDGPTVAFVNPGDGEEVSGQVTIEVEASDDDGVARVEFRLDGMPRGSDAEPPYQHLWQTANYTGTSHVLTAVAYDTLDNPTEASVTVTVAAAGGGEDAGSGGEGEEEPEPERYDPISWGCSAQLGGGRGCGPVAALGLALLLAALFTARGGGLDRSRRRRRRAGAQQRDGG
jgi:hypothetical protein